MVDLSTTLAGVSFPNPIFTASGCAGYGRELGQFFEVSELGAVVTKSIMARPRSGRPTPRMAETPSGMLNSIGLQGPGVDAFIEHDLSWLHEQGARVVVSVAGGSTDEFVSVARRLDGHPAVALLEINISCPNVENRGQVFACDVISSSRVISAVRRAVSPQLPIFAKLTPDVTDICLIARACADAGADGLSLINTLLGMEIDIDTLAPALGGVTGGLSGPAIRPVALRCVWQVHRVLPHLPIIGMGGIRTGADALAFLLAGASAVSVGTAVFGDPSVLLRVREELAQLVEERGFSSLAQVIGLAHLSPDERAARTEHLPSAQAR